MTGAMESIPQAVDTLSAAIATILTGGVAFFIGWEGGVRACRASAAYRPFARGFQNRPAGNSSAVDPRQIHLNVVIGAMVISGGVFYGVWKWRILKANEVVLCSILTCCGVRPLHCLSQPSRPACTPPYSARSLIFFICLEGYEGVSDADAVGSLAGHR